MNTASLTQADVERIGAQWACAALRPLLLPGRDWFDTARTTAWSAPVWQRTFGDFIGVFRRDGRLRSLEVKAERRWTGNLFLETWSNRTGNAELRRDGWMFTLQADLIAFAFLDADAVLVTDFRALKEWAFSDLGMYEFPERVPHLSLDGKQKNRTVGHIVPVAHLAQHVTLARYTRDPQADTWTRELMEVAQ